MPIRKASDPESGDHGRRGRAPAARLRFSCRGLSVHPFLLLDDFRSDTRDHYSKGFPWHPHRGIETITCVLRGDLFDIVIEPECLDLSVPASTEHRHDTKRGHTVFVDVFEGAGVFGDEQVVAGNHSLVLFGDGDQEVVRGGDAPSGSFSFRASHS